MTISDFQSLLAPQDADAFRKVHFGKSYIHIKGDAAKTQSVMTFDKMSELMSRTSTWTPASMMVVLERKNIPAEQYCTATPGSGILRPDPEKVQSWIRRGASVVLNDIDELTPEVKAIAQILEKETGGLSQANLYFSMRQRQAFGPHYDTHDVFALHCCGEKVWRIYDGRADGPINHPSFKKSGPEFEKMVGELAEEVTLQPGDLLYLPRGVYHDALASDNGAVHIAYGVTMPKYLDLLPLLWEAAVHSSLMRSDMPVKPGPMALEKALSNMGKELTKTINSNAFKTATQQTLDVFSPARQDYDINALTKLELVYMVTPGMSLQTANGKTYINNGRDNAEVPGGFAPMITWVIQRSEITMSELTAAFPAVGEDMSKELVKQLGIMGVLA